MELTAENWYAGEEAVAAPGASDNVIVGAAGTLAEEGMTVMLQEESRTPPFSLVLTWEQVLMVLKLSMQHQHPCHDCHSVSW